MKLTRQAVLGGAMLSGALLASSVATASEPLNNNPPWVYGTSSYHEDMSVFISLDAPAAGWNGFEEIVPSGDVDYFIVGCGRPYNQGGNGSIASIVISFTHSLGDIDIVSYKLDGDTLKTSAGVGNSETVNLSTYNLNAVVLKVYGYNGAQNSYNVTLNCQG